MTPTTTMKDTVSQQAVLKLASDLADVQRQQIESRERARQIDHDILIKIQTNVEWIREAQTAQSVAQAKTDLRVTEIERIQNEQKGAWKMAMSAGAVGGAAAGFLASILKH